MRTDPAKDQDFVQSSEWKSDGHVRFFDRGTVGDEGERLSNSFSGHERNRLFINRQGQDFADLSLVSGLDSKADGRAMLLWDFDRDGWTDIAVVNANSPQLEIFRNMMGTQEPTHRYLALRFIGASRQSAPVTSQASNRDGYGTKVWVYLDDGETVLFREHRCGEGFSAQNSATMLVGIGECDVVSKVLVRWPSGREQVARHVSADQLLVWHESRSLRAYDMFAYEPIISRSGLVTRSTQQCVLAGDQGLRSSRFTLFVAMASWCEKCKRELPQLRHLRNLCSQEQLRIVGFPADHSETEDAIQRYLEQQRPPYEIMHPLTDADREVLESSLSGALLTTRLSIPAVMLVDNAGRVVAASTGVPDASWLVEAMATP